MKNITLLNSIINQISHQLRSPLSAVSNDLQYILKVSPNLETDRTLNSANRISNILSEHEEFLSRLNKIIEQKALDDFVDLVEAVFNKYSLSTVQKNKSEIIVKKENTIFDNLDNVTFLKISTDILKKEATEFLYLDIAISDLNLNYQLKVNDSKIIFSIN
jgi:hypothetical protein